MHVLVELSGHSWPFNNSTYKHIFQKVVGVIGQQKVKHYAIYIEKGISPEDSLFTSWNFMLNIFYGTPMESHISAPTTVTEYISTTLSTGCTPHIVKYPLYKKIVHVCTCCEMNTTACY